ncbi:TRAP transporter substrate-binding protein DctP [Rhodobacteraceae bacterium LMO-12]|nr:TRAP transporter substrate-binding protein DctP [Rhodobacteraceae bacterium LMO-JJ12]
MGRIVSCIAVLALALFGAGGVAAQASLRLGTTAQADGIAGRFAEAVSQIDPATKVDTLVGIVGPSDLQEMAQAGLVDIAVLPLQLFDLAETRPLQQPFLADGALEFRQVLNSEVGAYARYGLEEEGFRVLAFWQTGARTFASTTPIENIANLEGKTVVMRPNDPSAGVLAAVGAKPVNVAFAEVFAALDSGAFDSTTIAPYSDASISLGFNRVVSYAVDRPFSSDVLVVLMPIDTWGQLDIVSQTALVEAAEAVAGEWDERVQADIGAFRETAADNGIRLAAWSEDDFGTVRTVAASQANEFFGSDIGGEIVLAAYAAGSYGAPAPVPSADDLRPAETQEVYFVTDRARSSRGTLGQTFSGKRTGSNLTFGEATVEMKSSRRLDDDVEDATEFRTIDLISQEAFNNQVLTEIAAADQPVVIFVHGYNTSFSEALARSATVRADIAPEAVVILFSWASEGTLLAYAYDESSWEIGKTNFKDFLRLVMAKVPTDRISLVAHSMGSRLLLDFIESLQDRDLDPDDARFADFVFAASDVSKDRFLLIENRTGRHPLSAFAEEVTVYVSQYDRPLYLSYMVHRDERLGRSVPEDMVDDPDIVAIDAADIDPRKLYQAATTIMRHSYVFDKVEGVTDLAETLAEAVSPGTGRERRTIGIRDYLGLKKR